MRASVWHSHDIRYDLLFSQALVVRKEEDLVLLDRSADARAELILVIRRRFRGRASGFDDGVEEVARFKFVVAKKLVSRSVKVVGPRSAGSIDHSAVAAELSRVRVGQRLKLSDGLDSQCRA